MPFMRAVGLALLVSVTGCDQITALTDKASGGDDDKPSVGGKKVDVDWKDEDTFEVEGSPGKTGEVSIFEGTYQVTLNGFPKGTQWKAGKKKGEVESEVYDILKLVELDEEFGTLPATDPMKGRIDPDLELEVQSPDGTEFKVKLPPANPATSVEDRLKKVENGPVKFGKEKKDKEPNENVLYLGSTLDWKLFGRAEKLVDVDRIAIPNRLGDVKGKKTCSGYKDNDGKSMPDLELILLETEVKVYDRRTGDVLEKKVFPPDEDCPMFAFQSKDDDDYESSIPTQAIESWLRSLVK